MKDIIYQDLDGAMRTGSEKDVMRVSLAHAIHYGKPFITIDERHMTEKMNHFEGIHGEAWKEFATALDYLIDAGEIYCAILTERDEDGNECK